MKILNLIKKSLLLGALAVTVAACSPNNSNNTKDLTKPILSNVSNIAAITVDSTGVVASDETPNSKYNIDVWFDPSCPHCLDLHRETAPFIEGEIKTGKLSITYHPVAFLDTKTVDRYSTRIAIMLVGVAEYEPAKFPAFINEVMSGAIYPQSETDQTPDIEIAGVMEKVGVSQSTINKINSSKSTLAEIVAAGTQEFRLVNKEKYLKLASLEGAKNSYTPFVTINKTGEFKNKTFHPEKEGENWLSVLKSKYLKVQRQN